MILFRTLLQSIVQFFAAITDTVFGSGLVEEVEELRSIRLTCLCEALCLCVQVASSPDHHDLAIMETALSSIINIASRYSYKHHIAGRYMYLW